jgi:hypothetical protein
MPTCVDSPADREDHSKSAGAPECNREFSDEAISAGADILLRRLPFPEISRSLTEDLIAEILAAVWSECHGKRSEAVL